MQATTHLSVNIIQHPLLCINSQRGALPFLDWDSG